MLKVPPPTIQADGTFELQLRSFHSRPLSSDREFYLWSAETQGGAGLLGAGHIRGLFERGSITVVEATLELRATRKLGNSTLRHLRDTNGRRPDETLARKIYRYSHNRAVSLSEEEARFLSEFL